MNTKPLSAAQVTQFHRDGYLICRRHFDQEEMDLLLKTARADHNMLSHNIPVKDAAGRQSKLALWNHPGYTPLAKVDDSMIKKTGLKGSSAAQTSWLNPVDDKTTGAGKEAVGAKQ